MKITFENGGASPLYLDSVDMTYQVGLKKFKLNHWPEINSKSFVVPTRNHVIDASDVIIYNAKITKIEPSLPGILVKASEVYGDGKHEVFLFDAWCKVKNNQAAKYLPGDPRKSFTDVIMEIEGYFTAFVVPWSFELRMRKIK